MGNALGGFLTILTIGAVGAIVFTLVTNPTGVTALFNGTDKLLVSSYGASLGKVA
jgi:hypothetical protein